MGFGVRLRAACGDGVGLEKDVLVGLDLRRRVSLELLVVWSLLALVTYG